MGALSWRIKGLSLPPALPEGPAGSSSLPWTPNGFQPASSGGKLPLTQASRAASVPPEEARLTEAPWSRRLHQHQRRRCGNTRYL